MQTIRSETVYTCSKCNKSLTIRCTLVNHSVVHGARQTYSCANCNEPYLCNNSLTTHTASHHTNIKEGKSPPSPRFLQVDGAFSVSSSDSSLSLPSPTSSVGSSSLKDSIPDSSWFSQTSRFDASFPIPVHTGFRPPKIPQGNRDTNNVRIRRDNRFAEASSLPAFTVFNMRSIWSKLNNLADDMEERNVDISFLSEVWEKKENKKHQGAIEHLLEMKGISYISTPRPGARRGGGTAIAANPKKFFLSKLNIDIPKPIEVVWGLLKLKLKAGKVSKIILCSFSSPPYSKKNTLLVNHISITLGKLRLEHPLAATIIAGDKNNLDDGRLLAIDSNFHQIVSQPSLNGKILDIIVTDLHRFYVDLSLLTQLMLMSLVKVSPVTTKESLHFPLLPIIQPEYSQGREVCPPNA